MAFHPQTSRTDWPPILRALLAQGLAFAVVIALARLLPMRLAFWLWPALQGVLAALLAAWWGLGWGWRCFQLLLPFALAWQLGQGAPGWIYLSLFTGLLLVFGGGILTRVPLYNSGSAAWEHLLALMPEGANLKMADLGAGLGGPLTYLARHRPQAQFVGTEASPLVWFIAWLRSLPLRRNCRIHLGSLWRMDLQTFDIVFAFLSPAPMPRLWEKALLEMRPGTLLVSHSFEIPGLQPERLIPLPGLPGACLRFYRIPSLVTEDAPEMI